MQLLKPYVSLSETLLMLKKQVRDSIPFAETFLPGNVDTPKQIFNFLRGEVVYFNDPEHIELLHSMPSLFSSKNQHGIYGAGDCDCFTIACLASLISKGYLKNFVILTGRSAKNAVHIYCKTLDDNGKKVTLDLTNKIFNYERFYPYKQELKFSMP